MLRRAGIVTMVLAVMACATAASRAQDGEPTTGQGNRQEGGSLAGMQRAAGEVTAVSGHNLSIKTADGTMTIVTTDNTRVMKGRGVTVKLNDLKVGDGVMAAGVLDAPNHTLHAAVVFATDAAQLKEMRENLGKTFIAGRVKSIDMDDARMTVERPDGVAQAIGFDETTSFRRGRRGGQRPAMDGAAQGSTLPETGESITLADIKPGDNVRGRGSLKNGVFVPTELVVMAPGGGARRSMESKGMESNSKPQTSAPGTSPN